ncbi:MAG: septum formation initiator family protein [Candidatus Ancillula sp.]|nr:septum formation initiator family protein [Candidatus Ancillula sp.]
MNTTTSGVQIKTSSSNASRKSRSGGFFLFRILLNIPTSLRFLISLFIIMASLVSLSGAISTYFRESKNLVQVKKENADLQKQKKYQLEEVSRWNDDKYVIAWARDHFNVVMPGETLIHISGYDKVGHEKDLFNYESNTTANTGESDTVDSITKPWYESVLDSVK